MIKTIKESDVKKPNFINDGKIYLVRCIDCGLENYAAAVASGQCAWCGIKFKLGYNL